MVTPQCIDCSPDITLHNHIYIIWVYFFSYLASSHGIFVLPFLTSEQWPSDSILLVISQDIALSLSLSFYLNHLNRQMHQLKCVCISTSSDTTLLFSCTNKNSCTIVYSKLKNERNMKRDLDNILWIIFMVYMCCSRSKANYATKILIFFFFPSFI